MHPTKRWMMAVAVLTLLMLGATATSVSANLSPVLCDAVPKYYCSRVEWYSGSNTTTVSARQYKGGLGSGGAQQWQHYYTTEWYSNGSEWVKVNTFGASGWYSSPYSGLSDWYNVSAAGIGYPYTDMAILMKMQFKEQSSPTEWYFWCSYNMVHYLNRGFSANEGTEGRNACVGP